MVGAANGPPQFLKCSQNLAVAPMSRILFSSAGRRPVARVPQEPGPNVIGNASAKDTRLHIRGSGGMIPRKQKMKFVIFKLQEMH